MCGKFILNFPTFNMFISQTEGDLEKWINQTCQAMKITICEYRASEPRFVGCVHSPTQIFQDQHGNSFSKRKEATDVNAKLFLQRQATAKKALMES